VTTIIKFIKKLLRRNKTEAPIADASHIITRKHHCISKTDISPNALKVLNRLISGGFEGYLVGGSVRDLLLRKAPKDFDVATNAKPNEIRQLFRNARVIGRRFKLVHILFQRDIIEVATFRGADVIDTNQQTNERGMLVRDNVYGSFEQDAWRRDFTVNSLYYNMHDASIIDLTGGVHDIKAGLIRMIGDPVLRYQEDPVRMLRAVRFCAKLHFNLEENTKAPLKTLSHLLTHVSSSRLFDEMTKLYQCGEAKRAQVLLVEHGLFAVLFPLTHEQLVLSQFPVETLVDIALQNTDARIKDEKPITPAFLFAILLWFPLLARTNKLQEEGIYPLPALEQAMAQVIAEQNQLVCIPKRFTQVMREIWLLQFKFEKRHGGRAVKLLEHPRFRAAYDFMALRALAQDESMELAQWWTDFQEGDEIVQEQMLAKLKQPAKKKPKKRAISKPS
jgi:poly(A) polymerase